MPNNSFFDPHTLRLVGPNNRVALLSPQEARVAAILADFTDGDVVDHQYLAEKVYGHSVPRHAKNTLRIVMLKLRRKMRAIDCPFELTSVYGKGYRLSSLSQLTFQFEDMNV